MSFIESLPFDIQNELMPFINLSPKELEEYPFRKNHREAHKIYFRVVLDELLLMTTMITEWLNDDSDVGDLDAYYVVASTICISLDTGERTDPDTEFAHVIVPRWQIAYFKNNINMKLRKFTRSFLYETIVSASERQFILLRCKLESLMQRNGRNFLVTYTK